MNRSIAIAAALVGLVVIVPSAAASSGSESTTAPPATTTVVTETPVTTKPSTTTTPVTTTKPATTTVTPATTAPTTVPGTGPGTPCLTDCIPTADACPDCIPSAGGGIPTAVAGTGYGGALPFTGIEDVIAPLLLALTVVLGGVVAWRWAQLRESVAEAARHARPNAAREPNRTGYALALRNHVIDQRARRMFTPRVA